jgi:hypothetical protein
MNAWLRWQAVVPASGRPARALTIGSVQAGPAAEETPSILGWEAQLVFFAFLTIVLVVPVLLAWEASHGDRRAAPTRVGEPTSDSLFSPDRERRLWMWTLVVLVAIYSTLSPAQTLAAELRARNLLGITSGVVLLALALIVIGRWVRTGPGRREIGAGVGVIAVYLVTLVRLPVPEARSHLFEYGLVAILIYHALLERRRNGRRVPLPALFAVLATALLGWVDEAIQYFLPNRVYDLVDVGLNAAFGLMAVAASVVVGWARKLDVRRALGLSASAGPSGDARPDP